MIARRVRNQRHPNSPSPVHCVHAVHPVHLRLRLGHPSSGRPKPPDPSPFSRAGVREGTILTPANPAALYCLWRTDLMTKYIGEPGFEHGEIPAVGILLANMGTPDAPTAPALRRYLKEFLWDPRVVEMPRAVWWLILNGIILNTRPRRSALLYQKVWTAGGSPLLIHTRQQAAALETKLRIRVGSPLHVAVGMRYGNPSIRSGLDVLRSRCCRRLLVLPLYPQYAASTTASTLDAIFKALSTWRWMPELRTVASYHDDPDYISALANSIREFWDGQRADKSVHPTDESHSGRPDTPVRPTSSRPEKLLFSFHGIPKASLLAGDPYHCQCHKTARLVAESLHLPPERWHVTFQSRFGRAEWLQPYTDVTLRQWGRGGVKSVDVICPGFSSDCLETIEEIAVENRGNFLHRGGERFRYIPALNDRPDHIDALASLAERHLHGWVIPKTDWDEAAAKQAASASRHRAEQMRDRMSHKL
jgi:ferrochelatase